MSIKTQIKADRLGNAKIAAALKNGPLTSGAAVKAAERMLKIAGFDVKVDDRFDAKSLNAIAQLDAAMGKPTDGTFDAGTFEALKVIQGRVRTHQKKGDVFLGRGQAGAEIAAAERRLAKLGYDVGTKDGVFDADLGKAVQAFKKDEKIRGDAQFLGDRSLKTLRADSAGFDHQAYRGRITKNLKAHRRLDQATTEAVRNGTLNARAIKNVQAKLRAAGFDPNSTNGKLDSRTQAALEAFQRKSGLPVNGTAVDAATWAKLKGVTFEAKDGTSPAQRLGEHSAAVKRSEEILKKLGFQPGKVDGVFDRATLKASRAFEKKFPGLGHDGRIGEGQLTRMKQLLHAKEDPGSGPLLKKGYRGTPVKALEKRLKKMGFDPGTIDGKFTDATVKAVKKFQRAFALKRDGVVGKGTWRKLGVDVRGKVITPGIHGSAAMKKLASASRSVAMSMGGFTSLGRCAAGVSGALRQALGLSVFGNGNQIDNNLPKDKFKQVHLSLAQALKTPGLVLTWERTSTTLGQRFGHTAITWGDGHTSSSDFIETNTLGGSSGRSGLKIFKYVG